VPRPEITRTATWTRCLMTTRQVRSGRQATAASKRLATTSWFLGSAAFTLSVVGIVSESFDRQLRLSLTIVAAILALSALQSLATRTVPLPLPLPAIVFGFSILWALASSVQSPGNLQAFAYGGTWLTAIAIAVAMASLGTEGRELVTRSLVVLLASALLLALLLPDRGFVVLSGAPGAQARFAGATGHPNMLGELAALSLIWFSLCPPQLPAIRLSATAAAVAALLMSGSRGALLSAIVVLAYCWVASPSRLLSAGTRRTVGLGVAVLAVVGWLVSERLRTVLARGGDQAELMSLAGRTDGYSEALQLFREQPLTGYGFASSREILPGFAHSHNLLLELLLSGGVVTAGLGTLAVLLSAAYAARRDDRRLMAVTLLVITQGAVQQSIAGHFASVVGLFWVYSLACSNKPAPSEPSAGRGHPVTATGSEGSP
jgi:exopolysaccharide production protein ExoQ